MNRVLSVVLAVAALALAVSLAFGAPSAAQAVLVVLVVGVVGAGVAALPWIAGRLMDEQRGASFVLTVAFLYSMLVPLGTALAFYTIYAVTRSQMFETPWAEHEAPA